MDCIDEIWQWATTEVQNTSSLHRFSITHGPTVGLGAFETSSGYLALAYGPISQTGSQTFIWYGQATFASDPSHPFHVLIDSFGDVFTEYTGGPWKGGPWQFFPEGCDKSGGKLNLYGAEFPLGSGLEAPFGGWFGTVLSLWSFPIWKIEIGLKVFEALKGPRPQRKRNEGPRQEPSP